MQQRPLARTGLKIGVLGLRPVAPESDAAGTVALLRRAVSAGASLIDVTAAPELVGRAMKGARREQAVLALTLREQQEQAPETLVAAIEDTLERLGTDWLDLCLIERSWIGELDATLAALTELVRSGEVLHLGTGAVPVSTLVEAQWVAEQRFFAQPAVAEVTFSLLDRAAEEELLPLCRRYGLSVLARSPLAGGWLTDTTPASSQELATLEGQRRRRQAEALAALAAEAGLTLPQLALAFVLRHREVAAAIARPRTPHELELLVASAEAELDDDLLARAAEIARPITYGKEGLSGDRAAVPR